MTSLDVAAVWWDTSLSRSNDILAGWPRFHGMCWSMLVGDAVYDIYLFGALLSVGAFSSTPSIAHSCNGLTALLNARLQSECTQHILRLFYGHVHSLVLACFLLLSFVVYGLYIHIHSLIQI